MFNTHVRDNLNWLKGDSGWTAPTFQNGWTNYSDTSFSPVGYRAYGPFTIIRGLAAGGTNGAAIFTLPVELRPLRDWRFSLASAQGAARGLWVHATGFGTVVADEITTGTSNTWVSVSCIFPRELV